jgi:hypothetical protein
MSSSYDNQLFAIKIINRQVSANISFFKLNAADDNLLTVLAIAAGAISVI